MIALWSRYIYNHEKPLELWEIIISLLKPAENACGKRLAYLMGWRFMNFARRIRDANVIPLCPEFLLFALHPHLCFGLVKRAGLRSKHIQKAEPWPHWIVFILHVYITARSATSAIVKIDAHARVVINVVTTAYRLRVCVYTRSNCVRCSEPTAMMIVNSVAIHEVEFSTKCNVRNRNATGLW